MTNMIKQLLAEFGFLTEDADIERNVKDQISRAAVKDQVDTIAFGLETDDGQIVKVYVNAEHAEKFEQEMAEMLGKVDDIEEALNAISKDIEIVDVEWPEEEGADAEDVDPEADDETDGGEVLNQKVYSDENKKKEQQDEGLSYGDELTQSLLAEAGGRSLADQLSTVNQHLIYQAILHLGVPELALDKSPYRSAILRGIKDTALELAHSPSMRSTLKTFIKQQALEDRSGGEDKKQAKDELPADEPVEAKPKDTKPKAIAKHVPKEPVEPKSVPTKEPVKPAPAPKPVKEALNPESTAGMYWEGVERIIKAADGSSTKSYAARVLSTQQFESLKARSTSRIVGRMTNGLRTKLGLLEKAFLAAEPLAEPVTEQQFSYTDMGELIGTLLKLGDDSKASLSERIIMSQAYKRLLLESRSTFGSLSANIKRLLGMLKLELDKIDLTEAAEPEVEDEPVDGGEGEVEDTEEEPIAAPAPAPATALDATDSGMSFESEGDSLKVSFPSGSFELQGESLERAMKALSNKQTLSVQLASGKFAVFSPRGSSAVIKLMGTETKVTMAPPDISAFLDAGNQVLAGDAENAKDDKPAAE